MEYILVVYWLLIHLGLIRIIRQKQYKDLAVFLCFTTISAVYTASYLFGFQQAVNPNKAIEFIFGPLVKLVFG